MPPTSTCARRCHAPTHPRWRHPPTHPLLRRCWSYQLTNASGRRVTVDLGAGWIHGKTNNVLVTLARQAGVSLPTKNTNYDNNVLYLASGREASDAQEAA